MNDADAQSIAAAVVSSLKAGGGSQPSRRLSSASTRSNTRPYGG